MWIPFCKENEAYMLKIKKLDGKYLIYVTNFKSIWFNEVNNESILQQFQELNPAFDVKLDEAVAQVIQLLHGIERAEVNVVKADDKMALRLKSYVEECKDSNIKIEYKLDMRKGDESIFAEELTLPMVHTVKYLEERQNILSNLIEKKDRELEEYKLEKGQISRDDLTTNKFDKNLLLPDEKEKLVLNVFSKSSSFWTSFAQQYGDVKVDLLEEKKDPWNHRKKNRKVYSRETVKKRSVPYQFRKDT